MVTQSSLSEQQATHVRIETQDEQVILGKPARVYVYEGNKLVTVVTAKVEPRQGADGGDYPSVTLKKQ